MSAADLTALRFRYSPVDELICALNMLRVDQVYPLHRGWADEARARLRQLDTTVLNAVVPAHRALIAAPRGTCVPATIDQQLGLLAEWPPHLLEAELHCVWQGHALPAAAHQIIADGPAGARRVAAALGQYWDAVIAPYWDQIRGALDAEIAYRGHQIAQGGIATLMQDLHPKLRLAGSTSICINKPRHGTFELGGRGLVFIPCVFAGVNAIIDPGETGPATILYGPRGLGAVWEASGASQPGSDALAVLVGRGRAAVLRATGLPKSTSELSVELKLSGPTVSVHLATLRECGLVTSWRSGRRVLYQNTPLAASLLAGTGLAVS